MMAEDEPNDASEQQDGTPEPADTAPAEAGAPASQEQAPAEEPVSEPAQPAAEQADEERPAAAGEPAVAADAREQDAPEEEEPEPAPRVKPSVPGAHLAARTDAGELRACQQPEANFRMLWIWRVMRRSWEHRIAGFPNFDLRLQPEVDIQKV